MPRPKARKSETEERRKPFRYKDGKIFFDRRLEQAVFFILTIIMLLWGAWGSLVTKG